MPRNVLRAIPKRGVELVDPIYDPITMPRPEAAYCESCERERTEPTHAGIRRDIGDKIIEPDRCSALERRFKKKMRNREGSLSVLAEAIRRAKDRDAWQQLDAVLGSRLKQCCDVTHNDTIGGRGERRCPVQLVGARATLGVDEMRGELCELFVALSSTFEMQRLRHIQMTGFVSRKFPSSTHTRFSHAVGTWIAAWNALKLVVVRTDFGRMSLGDFLRRHDLHREFMASLFIHDIGHAPFSHVLEMNRHLQYNHEDVSRELIRGTGSYWLLRQLMQSIGVERERGQCDPFDLSFWCTPRVGGGGSGAQLVHDVLRTMGVNIESVVSLLSPKLQEGPTKGSSDRLDALRGLVDDILDIDRLDHVYRDLHYNSFKTVGAPMTAFLSSLCVDDTTGRVYVEESAMPVVEALLVAREQSHKAIFDSTLNSYYIAVLNGAISDMVSIAPVFAQFLPFLTDEALLYSLSMQSVFGPVARSAEVSLLTSSAEHASEFLYVTCALRMDRAGDGEQSETLERVPKFPDDDKDDKKGELRRHIANTVASACERTPTRTPVLWSTHLRSVAEGYSGAKSVFAVGSPETPGPSLAKHIQKLVAGLVWDSQPNRSWTFTLFTRAADTGNVEAEARLQRVIADVRSSLDPVWGIMICVKGEVKSLVG